MSHSADQRDDPELLNEYFDLESGRVKSWARQRIEFTLRHATREEMAQHPGAPYVLEASNGIVRAWVGVSGEMHDDEQALAVLRRRLATHLGIGYRGGE